MEALEIHVLRKGSLASIRDYSGHRGPIGEWTLHVKCRVEHAGIYMPGGWGEKGYWATTVRVTESGALQFGKGQILHVPTFGVSPRSALYWERSRSYDYFSGRYVTTSRGLYHTWGIIPDDPAKPCPATLVDHDGRLMRVHTFGDLLTTLHCPFTSARVTVPHSAYRTVTPGQTYRVDYYGRERVCTIPECAR